VIPLLSTKKIIDQSENPEIFNPRGKSLGRSCLDHQLLNIDR